MLVSTKHLRWLGLKPAHPVHSPGARTEELALFSYPTIMNERNLQSQGFIDVQTVADAMKLTDQQRVRFAERITTDVSKSKIRSDGSLPMGVAITLCKKAKGASC